MTAGHANNIFIATNKSQAVYAESVSKVIGVIVFDIKEDYIKSAYIIAGGVETEYRNRGIYKLLHQQLEELAKQLGCSKIRSEVHPNNTAMINTFTSLGKRIAFYRTEKDL